MSSLRRTAGVGSRGRGFSLVEVLLAVLVLGLGLLGLAAVFPVVISQQRESFDTVSAGPVRVAAESYVTAGQIVPAWNALLSDPGFDRMSSGSFPENPDTNTPEDTAAAWVEEANLDWVPDWTWDGMSVDPGEELRERGDLYVNVGTIIAFSGSAWGIVPPNPPGFPSNPPGSLNDPQVVSIPVEARLFPAPFSGAAPQFVWDAVPRRTVTNGLQLAIFIRRVDTGIRAPEGFTLSDVLTGAASDYNGPVLLPVGEFTRDGRPTGQGAAEGGGATEYSLPVRMDATLPSPITPPDEEFEWVRLRDDLGVHEGRTERYLRRAGRVGQFLVDNLGVVREVVEVDPFESGGGFVDVRVDPPFVESQQTGSQPNTPAGRSSTVRSVVFTPQQPAVAPIIITIAGDAS